jgi:DNA-binding response OmpR family regulator
MPKVLLIDDDIELTSLLSEYLIEEGFDVETSDDARVGIAHAAGGTVDIIVLDVMMPRMNGIDALQRIRRLQNTPVLMLTAKDDDVDRISGLNLGADDYISNPALPANSWRAYGLYCGGQATKLQPRLKHCRSVV